jgi:hypothetical protein
MKSLQNFYIFLSIAIVFAACGDRVTIESSLDEIIAEQQQYFPLTIGQVIEYQCDSIVYDFAATGGTIRDTSTTFIREAITDTLRTPSGELSWIVERSERNHPDSSWVVRRIWSATVSNQYAARTEENLRFMRLVFPMDKRSEWNGNLWIEASREIEIAGERVRPFADWQYEVDSIDVSQRVGAFEFDSVLVITEVDQTNVIERRLSRSRYAKGVGLVSKEQLILDSQYCNRTPAPVDCETKPWVDKAEKGYILRQTVTRY